MSESEANRRGRIRRALRISIWASLGILAIAILVRASIVASTVQGGWRIFGDQFVASLPPVLDTNSHEYDSFVRAREWLMEQIARIENDPNSTAADYMGAALAIESGLAERRVPDSRSIPLVIWGRFPRSLFTQDGPQLVSLMRQLARRATELEPGNKQWWRLFALMSRNVYTGRNDEPADVSAIEAASVADPDNALYDYLLGTECYEKSLDTTPFDDVNGSSRIVVDLDSYAAAQKYFSAAFTKDFAATGEAELACATRFLTASKGPLDILLRYSNAEALWKSRRGVQGRSCWLFSDDCPPTFRTFGSVKELSIYLWFIVHNPETFWDRQVSNANESWLYGHSPATDAERRRVDLAFQYRWQLEERAIDRWEFANTALVVSSTAAVAFWLFAASFLIAGTVSLLLRSFQTSISCSTPLVTPVALFAGAFCATFVVLECLRNFRELEVAWFRWGALATGVIAVLGSLWILGRFVFRQGRLGSERRSHFYQPARLLLAIVSSFIAIVPLLVVVDPKIRKALSLAVTRSSMQIGEHFNHAITVGIYPWNWGYRLLEWAMNGGLYWTLALWFVSIALLSFRSLKRANASSSQTGALTAQGILAGLSRRIAIGSVAVAIPLLFLCIAATTQWAVGLQEEYDRQFARLSNPRWFQDEIEAAAKAVPAASSVSGQAGGPLP